MAKLHFIHSVMNAGKSTQLLQARHNYVENGGHVLVFTSALDDRGGKGRVTSRLGISCEAIALRAEDDMRAITDTEHVRKPVTAVLVDEVQFLTPAHVLQAASIADDLRIPVL